MKSISKLKDEARKYEQREEWEKAIQAYLQVLKIADDEETEVELPLYNRLGDICVRQGRPDEAVRHYEQAADRYAEAGLYNNAIALCNKALRYNRDRLELIRKLGQFSAQQGFITDARRYFLDYAERQFNAGRVDDALTALEDFADVSDDAEVREMLGRRMLAHGRRAGAMNALQRAYALRLQAGENDRAEALLAEMHAMDPDASPSTAAAPPARGPSHVQDLPGLAEPEPDVAVPEVEDPAAAPLEGLEPGDVSSAIDAGAFEITDFGTAPGPVAGGGPEIEGLERGAVDFGSVEPGAVEDLGIVREESSFGDDMFPESGPVSSGESFDLPLLDEPEEATPLVTPQVDLAPIDLGSDFSFDFGGFGTAETPAPARGGEKDPGDDLDPPAAGADDDGFDLSALVGADDDGIALADDDSDSFDLPTLDDDVELPTLDDDVELPTLDDDVELPTFAAEEPDSDDATFDGESVVEAEPPAWQPEPGPALEPPTFEPGQSGYDAVADASFDVPELEEPEVEPAAPPEPKHARAPSAPAGPPADQIPAIELPTWDTDAPQAEEVGIDQPRPVVDATAAGDAWLDDADEPALSAAEADAAGDDWLDDGLAGDATAVEEELPPPEPEPAAPAVEDVPPSDRRVAAAGRERKSRAPAPPADDGFIDLGALITEDDDEDTTRFRIQETAPTGDEDRDFAELLSQFKGKVQEHLPTEDASAHYDLGLAFKEMGLIDEAIGEFQVALRAVELRLRVYEELGQCFLMKEQYNIAEKVLTRALETKYDDELELLGVYYHLGRAYEALGRRDQARDAYERVLGMDINFEDVTTRLARL